jgi:hypothetical protein
VAHMPVHERVEDAITAALNSSERSI